MTKSDISESQPRFKTINLTNRLVAGLIVNVNKGSLDAWQLLNSDLGVLGDIVCDL
jgi:hypothetical protein